MLGVHQWEVLSLFLIGDIPPNTSPLSHQYPPNTPQLITSQYAPLNITPIPISMPEAWAWAQGPGPMGIEGYWRGIRLGGIGGVGEVLGVIVMSMVR